MKKQIPENLINLDTSDMTSVEDGIGALSSTIAPATSEIAPEQKKDYQQIGPKLESMIRIAQFAAQNNSGAFPQDYTTDRIDKALQNYDDFKHIRSLLAPVMEIIDETIAVNGIVAADEMNYIYETLQLASVKNPALKKVIEPIVDYYKRGKKKDYSTINLEKGTSISLKGVAPGSRVINAGSTRISMDDTVENAGRSKRMGTIYIEPGNSFVVPAGITAFTVKNLSVTEPASFLVKLKP